MQYELFKASETSGKFGVRDCLSEADRRAGKLLTIGLRGKQGTSGGKTGTWLAALAAGSNAGCVCLKSGAVAAAEKVTASTGVARRMK